MPLLPPVRAKLAERFIFNFRMPTEAFQKYMPVKWLAPADVAGHAVASFCMLDLRHITIAPMPTILGLSSVSCAPRYAATDLSAGTPRPAVFVTERQTNSAFGAWFTRLGFSAPHRRVHASIRREGDVIFLSVKAAGQENIFEAAVRPSDATPSAMFDCASFKRFIAEGVSSYGLSRHGSRLTKLDLHKEDTDYHSLEVLEMSGAAVEEWLKNGAEFDSAFRTSGGRYEWRYLGMTD
jgi:hypothetical protein